MQRETIEATRRPPDSRRNRVSRSEVAFCYFFNREDAFAALRPYAREFYDCVRCGILHQGESSGGWRIWRRGPAFDEQHRTINASKFLTDVGCSVAAYRRRLEATEWEDRIWNHFTQKMKAVVANCQA
jgi:hypothetical protein